MIEVSITQEIIERSAKKSDKMGVLNHSILKGEGNLVGFIGEEVVARYLLGKVANTYDYDVIFKSLKIDVKTKKTSVKPRPEYDCTINAYNTTQECDWYAFVRVSSDLEKAWILGYMPRDEYYTKAVKWSAGDYDPSNKFTFKTDCYNMRIDQLYDLPNPLSRLKLTDIRGNPFKINTKCITGFNFRSDCTDILCEDVFFTVSEKMTHLFQSQCA